MQSRSPKMREAAGLPSKSQDTEKTLRAAPVPTWTQGAARTWARGLQEGGSSGGQGLAWPLCPAPIPTPASVLFLLLSNSCLRSAPVLVLPTILSLPLSHPCPYPCLISVPVLLCPSPCLCPCPCSRPVPAPAPARLQLPPRASSRPAAPGPARAGTASAPGGPGAAAGAARPAPAPPWRVLATAARGAAEGGKGRTARGASDGR